VSDGSVLALFARLLVSLSIVLALMWAAGRAMRSRGFGNASRPGSLIEVVARQSVGRTASIAVVRAAGKALIVSITDTQISLLAEADPDKLTGPEAQWTAPSGGAATQPGSPRKTLLELARERTVRR
jgi:flagellar protein FliO/FliZ